jgi:DNA-binding FadR family transcriptional regulator
VDPPLTGLAGTSLPAVERGNLTDRVQHLLRERILSGEWPAGTRLPAIERLAAEAGVSRTVAREAVKALSTQGLLSVVHGHGTVVAPGSNRPVVEALRYRLRASPSLVGIVEVRLALEVEAAALAAVRHTEEDVAALKAALDRMLVVEKDAQFVEADVSFHQAVVRATHNPVFSMIAEATAELMRQTRLAVVEAKEADPQHRRPAGDDGMQLGETHVAIFRRIVAGDREGAAGAMRSHLSGCETT